MDREQAIALIKSSLREGAELRTIVARDCSAAIFEAAGLITMCLRAGGKILFFGNGGSAADAQHLDEPVRTNARKRGLDCDVS